MNIKSKQNIFRSVMAAVAVATAACGAEIHAAPQDEPSDSVVSIVAHINASGHVSIDQPEALTERLSRRLQPGEDAGGEMPESTQNEASAAKSATAVRAGYRVQVFDDNNPRTSRSAAASYKSRIETAFPAYRAYVSFNSPYWRGKVGDFKSRAEAESAMADIRRTFPGLKAYIRIVRDRINIYD